ncbi:hypothetical protein [Streptomonospora wellingtoniae]|uniref:Uncharacterized protein n=1 Tax=Streptomonospora wellingtoniae TaxID=3075544 RepID=A0ABU2KZM4_9ACTN|nr:hypothetical protein [Streptomonospora sp. DSM 45055]MDT0304707.1 hypothetical protein [Streptomonospora sp. DSM 45055]
MPREVSEIMNIFADKGAKVGTKHHDLMPDKGSLLDPHWLIDGKYYPPSNVEIGKDPKDDFDIWWQYNKWDDPVWTGYTWSYGPDSGTHTAGYKWNEKVWDDLEPKFRDGLKRLTDVALDRGTWSTSYEKGTLTTIAREVNNLEMDLRDFVTGPDGKGGIWHQFEKINLSEEGGFKGTAAGAFGNRIFELAKRLEDMYEKLNKIDAPLSKIPDQLKKDLSNFEEKVNDWYYDPNTKAYNILYDWYYTVSAGSETWNESRGQFQAVIRPDGGTGIISDQDEQDDSKGSGPTTMAIKHELNRRWEEKFSDVYDFANALLASMDDVYTKAYEDLRTFEAPVGKQLPPYQTSGGAGGGGGGGGGLDIPDDLFEDVFPDDMFDDVFPDDMFDDVFPDGMFDDMFPDGMFDDMFPDGMFDDMFPDGMFDFDDIFPEDMFDGLNGPGGGGMDGPGGNYGDIYSGPGGGGMDGPGGNYGDSTPPPIPEGYSGPGGGGVNGPGGNYGNYGNYGDSTPPPMPEGYSGPGSGGLNDPGVDNPGGNYGNGGQESFIPPPPTGYSGPGGGGINGSGPGSSRNRRVLETDPETGLPINPDTGEPFPVDPETGQPYNPETGLPVLTDPDTGEVMPIDPVTGEAYHPDTGLPISMDPETGGFQSLNPLTGDPIGSEGGLPDLETDPETGLPINPDTGEPFPVDPETGLPYAPDTGLPVFTDGEGGIKPIDPETGYPEGYDPETDSPETDVPETEQSRIPPPNYSDYPDFPDYSEGTGGIDPPPTYSSPEFPDYSNGSNQGQGPQTSDRSSLFSGPPPDSASGPGTTDGSRVSGPGNGGMRTPGAEQGASGTGGGTGAGGSGGNGGGGPAGSQMQGQSGGMGNGMMPPMMPPGGMGGMGGGQQNDQRQRSTWLSEDERVWGTAANRSSPVLGRPAPGADNKRSSQRNEFTDAGGERTRTGTSAEDAPRGGGRKRKPGVGNRGGRRQEQTRGGDGERDG